MNLPSIGKHRARAVEAKVGKASTGTPQIAILFAVKTPDGAQETGEEITGYLYLSDGAFQRTIEALRHCGWQGDDLSDLSSVGSQDCEIEVAEETYNGSASLKVKWVNALGRGGVFLKEEMGPQELKAFAAQMRGKVRAVDGGKKPQASTPAPAQQPQRQAPPAQPPAFKSEWTGTSCPVAGCGKGEFTLESGGFGCEGGHSRVPAPPAAPPSQPAPQAARPGPRPQPRPQPGPTASQQQPPSDNLGF